MRTDLLGVKVNFLVRSVRIAPRFQLVKDFRRILGSSNQLDTILGNRHRLTVFVHDLQRDEDRLELGSLTNLRFAGLGSRSHFVNPFAVWIE